MYNAVNDTLHVDCWGALAIAIYSDGSMMAEDCFDMYKFGHICKKDRWKYVCEAIEDLLKVNTKWKDIGTYTGIKQPQSNYSKMKKYNEKRRKKCMTFQKL
jgi:hypothetical protein